VGEDNIWTSIIMAAELRYGCDKGIVWIKWVGTHKDYDKIDVKGVQHGR
jgi:mRNA-degrading endonuclease HigB of HigAB toxin-antitoxin module